MTQLYQRIADLADKNPESAADLMEAAGQLYALWLTVEAGYLSVENFHRAERLAKFIDRCPPPNPAQAVPDRLATNARDQSMPGLSPGRNP